MSILGGFQGLLYTSATKTGAATNRGVISRFNPILDPHNIDIEGTGSRDLYDILLGMPEPTLAIDMLPTDISFITTYQDGQTVIPFLHLKVGSLGLTFTNVSVNRTSVQSRHNEALSTTLELWAELGETLAAAAWGSPVTTPYRWLDTLLYINTVLETQWWEWRYEVVTNLQRLGNVQTKATREIDARHKRVTGQIIKDLRSFTEFTELMTIGSDPAKFPIRIRCMTTPGSGVFTDLLNKDSRWDRIEAPSGPEDLIAKRFPFKALGLA